MSDKIIVEFSRKKLKELCREIGCCYINSGCVLDCDKTDDKLLVCHIPIATTIYKIREQNNEIKPKFKVGDKLYVVDCWVERDEFGCIVNDECFVKTKPLIVDKILIDRYFIFYGERDTQIGEFIEESHCFATKEQAQAECDKRNKGG